MPLVVGGDPVDDLNCPISGKTKTEVKDKLRALHSELDSGVRTQRGYTVDKAVADWLATACQAGPPRP